MPISDALRDVLSSLILQQISLIKIHADAGTIRLAGYESPVFFNDETYLPYPFKLGPIQTAGGGSLPGMSIKTPGADGFILSIIEISEDLRGKQLDVITVFADHLDDPTVQITYSFAIESIEGVAEEELEIRCVPQFNQGINVPRRTILRDTCQWRYKEEGCWLWDDDEEVWVAPEDFLYPGETCMRTRTSCEYHNNFARFSAFPGLLWNNPYMW
jgi:phage-related protein